jgi:hypothetical protein
MGRVLLKERRVAAQNSRWRVYYDHVVDDRSNDVKDYLVVASLHSRPGRVAGVDILPVSMAMPPPLSVQFASCRRKAAGPFKWPISLPSIHAGMGPKHTSLRQKKNNESYMSRERC